MSDTTRASSPSLAEIAEMLRRSTLEVALDTAECEGEFTKEHVAAMKAELTAAADSAARLAGVLDETLAAFKKYARHPGSCNLSNPMPFSEKARAEYYAKGVEGCTCGLSAFVARLREFAATPTEEKADA